MPYELHSEHTGSSSAVDRQLRAGKTAECETNNQRVSAQEVIKPFLCDLLWAILVHSDLISLVQSIRLIGNFGRYQLSLDRDSTAAFSYLEPTHLEIMNALYSIPMLKSPKIVCEILISSFGFPFPFIRLFVSFDLVTRSTTDREKAIPPVHHLALLLVWLEFQCAESDRILRTTCASHVGTERTIRSMLCTLTLNRAHW